MTEEIRLNDGVMAEEIRVVEHYSASILNKVGEGARVLGALRDAGVNLIAFWGYKHGAGRAQLEFIPEDSATFVAAAKQAKLRLRKSTALYIHGEDRPGAIADILGKLAGGAHQCSCRAGGASWRGKLRHNRLPPASCRSQGCERPERVTLTGTARIAATVLKGTRRRSVLDWQLRLATITTEVFAMISKEVQPPDPVPCAESEASQPRVSPSEDPDKIRGEVFKRMFPDVPREPSE